jgi:small multidrug resistance pump
MKLITWGLLFLLIFIEVLSEYLIKASVTYSNLKYLYLGVLTYLLVGVAFYFYIKGGESFAVLNTIWQGSNVVIIGLLSYFLLNEKLSYTQIIGMLVTLFGIILVNV